MWTVGLRTLVGPTGGWKRRVAIGLAGVAVAGGIALADKPDPHSLKTVPLTIESRALPGFDKQAPDQHRFGRLDWRGGAILTSPSRYFGGWSGIAVDGTGRRVVAVSDSGSWMTGELTYRAGRLVGISAARIGALQALGGKPLVRARDRDAEAVALVGGTLDKGSLLISFEGNDRIGRFAIDASGVAAPSAYIALPQEVKAVRSVDGIEAVTVLRGGPARGATVAFSEHVLPKEQHHSAWIWQGETPRRFSVTDIEGFGITDAVGLNDGSVVILERRFRWLEGVRARLRLLPAAEIRPGAVIAGEILLAAGLGQEIDNMEGVTAHSGPDGEMVLTLVSDDNFNPLLQRTLIMQFSLAGARQPAPRDREAVERTER